MKELEFLGGKIDPKTGRRVARSREDRRRAAREGLDPRRRGLLRDAQGVLGEQFLAIDPGSPTSRRSARAPIVKGIDPPRLDLFLAKAYELLDTTVDGIKNNRETLGESSTNTAGLLKGLNFIVTGNRERIERIVANVEEITVEAKQLCTTRASTTSTTPSCCATVDNIDKLTTRSKTTRARCSRTRARRWRT